jgi:hypothetical protein
LSSFVLYRDSLWKYTNNWYWMGGSNVDALGSNYAVHNYMAKGSAGSIPPGRHSHGAAFGAGPLLLAC